MSDEPEVAEGKRESIYQQGGSFVSYVAKFGTGFSAFSEAARYYAWQQKSRDALFSSQALKLGTGFSAFSEAARYYAWQQKSRDALFSSQALKLGTGFSAFSEAMKLSMRTGLSSSLAELGRSSSLGCASTAFQLAKLARATEAFSGSISPLSETAGLSAALAVSSAARLNNLYSAQPAFSDPITRASLAAVQAANPESVDLAARALLEDEKAAPILADLAEGVAEKIGQAGDCNCEQSKKFSLNNIAPGAVLLGVLVILFGGAADVIGAVDSDVATSIDRQFMYVSFGMATLYFLYQEGKR
ncbi:hypothetical protein [Streptomyces sp. bgisy154]|uniref:hypothetical protein n=1 Tax=Streptomyces sp. bgisy154 TaxID=3413794 RepID=UPI003D70319B